jgi:DNA-binding NarL/FixJ family response regulator
LEIAIADDHEIVRSGLKMLIEQTEDMCVGIEAGSYRELVAKLEESSADSLILDLNLGDSNGVESVKNISSAYPDMPVLVLSAYPEEQYAVQAFRAGAAGYLNKRVVMEELITALERITKGERYISKTLQETLPYGLDLKKDAGNPLEKLSRRELEVLSNLAVGHSPKEIAEILGLSPKTISTYRHRILEKLELSSTSQLLRFSYENGIFG